MREKYRYSTTWEEGVRARESHASPSRGREQSDAVGNIYGVHAKCASGEILRGELTIGECRISRASSGRTSARYRETMKFFLPDRIPLFLRPRFRQFSPRVSARRYTFSASCSPAHGPVHGSKRGACIRQFKFPAAIFSGNRISASISIDGYPMLALGTGWRNDPDGSLVKSHTGSKDALAGSTFAQCGDCEISASS